MRKKMKQNEFIFANTIKSEWVHPTEFPSMKGHPVVAIDLETCDTDLKKMGPGWPRGIGKVIGIAISDGQFSAYYPIDHDGGGNMDKKAVLKYIKSVCEDDSIDKVFHNAQYDIGWLWRIGIEVKGYIHDTMIAAALIDENRFSYALNSIASQYLGEYKNEATLKKAAAELGLDPKSEMYKMNAQFVGEYAEADARLTLQLHERLKIEIEKDSLQGIYDIECRLINVIFNMTRKGVRVDMTKAFTLKSKLKNKEKKILKRVKDLTGFYVDLWSARSVAKAFDTLNLEYPMTEKTNAPSFTQTFLETHAHELPRLITKARVFNKLQGTFIDGIAKYIHNDRIHAHINQIRSDTGGTVTGRFSMYCPNLQQIPIRGEMGVEIRKIFIPEEGEEWLSADYSQQEPRLLTHFAVLNKNDGAHEVQQAYKEKDLDFHQQTADMADIPRKLAKTIGLGVMYGMGYKKMAVDLDITPLEAKNILKEFRIKVPFMQGMLEDVMNRASAVGTIRTLLGRKCRFDLYEPSWFTREFHKALPLKQAEAEYTTVKRAGTYKALNRLIQGSAADQTKKAMVDVHEELGIVPLIQVHDELNCSVKDRKEGEKIKEIMETCVALEVPSKVEYKVDQSWGHAK
jgi:DNA polymerase I-like protein with 3'-5' exonuclease and polymerase domains|tara:strand:+ start:6278 stop:8158 length:1881 start_codon:yes stop_codon:yes gene_type:complete